MIKTSSIVFSFLLILLACNVQPDKRLKPNSDKKIVTYYNLRIKNSDSLAQPEIILELIIENRNNFGVMIKTPFFTTKDSKTYDEYPLDYLIELSDYDKIPTYIAYEDSLGNPNKNPLRFALEKYVNDSLSKRNIKLDSLHSDVFGFTFVNSSSKSIFLLDLTILLNKVNGEFKIYAYNDNYLYNYSLNYVPAVYQGYRKVAEDIPFDTFYIALNKKPNR